MIALRLGNRGLAAASFILAAILAFPPGSAGESIVGSWFGRVRVLDPPPPPTLDEFDSFVTFHGDGTVIESRRYYFGPFLETTGHGAWKVDEDESDTYRAFFRFGVQSAPPSTATIVGTDNVRLELTYDESTDTLTGTFTSEIRASDGTLLLGASGEYSAERIQP